MMINHSHCKHIKASLPFIGYRNYKYLKEDIINAFEKINKERLFRVGFGYNAKNESFETEERLNKIALKEYEEMKENIISNDLIKPVLITSYYKTQKSNNSVFIIDENNNTHKLPLNTINSNSIADFYNDGNDIISLIFSSLGNEYHEYIKKLNDNSEYKKYYFYHILGSYLVDSFQDILQDKLYENLNLETTDENNNILNGTRYSFGYEALKDLSGNKIIYELLNIKKYGIKLSDTFMFEPELSTAAIISFCKYSKYISS